MQKNLAIASLVIIASLVVTFSYRASVDAVAVVVGVVLGITASLPTTLLLAYVLLRQRQQSMESHRNSLSAQPPVVVINAPEKPALVPPRDVINHGSTVAERKWTVIGDSDTTLE